MSKDIPAFPSDRYSQLGMTLRDYFAGQALPAAIKIVDRMSDETSRDLDKEAAMFAYGIADALLEARDNE